MIQHNQRIAALTLLLIIGYTMAMEDILNILGAMQ